MCTVTFIPSGNAIYITSSRDEYFERPVASQPKIYSTDKGSLLYPRDPLGGGTWIAINENGHVGVLLNGAIKQHVSKPPYQKSRGLVLLDLISQTSPADSFEEMNFEKIEPFTVILYENKRLYSGKWDGSMKWIENLNPNQPQIWSSVTLYDTKSILLREKWFARWVGDIAYPGTLDIIHFHQHGGDGNLFNNILMNRDNTILTNSISSIRLSPDGAVFRYIDLRNGSVSETGLAFEKNMPVII